MAPDPSMHPKLTWQAWLRDILFALAASLAVLLVLGVLGYGVLLLDILCAGGVRRERAELDIANLQHALKLLYAKTGRVPTTEEGLRVLVSNRLIEQLPDDPWGTPYHYELRDERPVVWSYGADGLPGGEGENADVAERHRK